jgi:hypothetical protein
VVGAVQVGDAPPASVLPDDLGGDGLACRAQAAGAELPPGGQAARGAPVGVGGQPVAAAVRVVEVDVHAACLEPVQGGVPLVGHRGVSQSTTQATGQAQPQGRQISAISVMPSPARQA